MKFLVRRDELEAALLAAGFCSDAHLPCYSLRQYNERGGWYRAAEDEESVVVDVSVNSDGTWGYGRIIPPPGAIRLD